MGRCLLSSASLFSCMELGFSSITRSLSSSMSWWRRQSTEFNFSFARLAPDWTILSLYRPLDLGFFAAVDAVLWAVITALESVALVSMLCFFFLFCGCTL